MHHYTCSASVVDLWKHFITSHILLFREAQWRPIGSKKPEKQNHKLSCVIEALSVADVVPLINSSLKPSITLEAGHFSGIELVRDRSPKC
jgi:hypothetical protein